MLCHLLYVLPDRALIPGIRGAKFGESFREGEYSIRYGLVVRIPGSHPGGPGSIPGVGNLFR